MVALFEIGFFAIFLIASYPIYIFIEAKKEGKTFAEHWKEIEG